MKFSHKGWGLGVGGSTGFHEMVITAKLVGKSEYGFHKIPVFFKRWLPL